MSNDKNTYKYQLQKGKPARICLIKIATITIGSEEKKLHIVELNCQ